MKSTTHTSIKRRQASRRQVTQPGPDQQARSNGSQERRTCTVCGRDTRGIICYRCLE